MHEGRLRQLHQLLPRAEANAEQCHADAADADALVRDTKAAIVKETKERRHLRPLIFVPGGFGVAAALRVWRARPRGALVAAGGSATVVAAGAIALAVINGPQSPMKPRPALTTGALPSVEPLPAAGHWPPPTGPPKGPPPKAVPTAPPSTPPVSAPSPTPELSAPPSPVASEEPPTPKPHKPPKTKPPKPPKTKPPGKPPKTPPPVEPPVAQQRCALTLLDVGLLCDRSLITGAQPFMWPSAQTPTI